MNQDLKLETPQRQAPLGVIVIFFMNLRKWVNVFLVALIPLFRGEKGPIWIPVLLLCIIILTIAIISYFQWKRFLYYMSNDKFIIKQGILKKEETIIPLERIQSVHIKQNIIQQFLKLAALQLDTAGSGVKEAQIRALNYNYAQELKKHLIHLKEGKSTLTEQNSVNTSEEQQSSTLMQLNLGDLLKVGLTENHLRSGLLLFALFYAITNQVAEMFSFNEENFYSEAYTLAIIVLPVVIFGFLLFSVLTSLVLVFLRYYNLTVELKKTGLHIQSGLTKRVENLVPVNKIQYLRWWSNPLRKIIGYRSLFVYQAASTELNKKKAVNVPGCTKEHYQQIMSTFYPEFSEASKLTIIKPHRLWGVRLALFYTGIPALILLLGFIPELTFVFLAYPVYAIITLFFIWKYVQKQKVMYNNYILVKEGGYVYPQQTIMKSYKVQNIAIKQSFIQKRNKLVSIAIYTAAGKLSVPFISEREGYALANHLIYFVETSNKSWM